MSEVKPTMRLVTSTWGNQKSFRLMPVIKDCPYSEGIYDPDSKVLVMMSSLTKESLHFVPKVDDNGDPIKAKISRPNGKSYREQRIQLETFTEYYISEETEIKDFIHIIATNAVEYDFETYLTRDSENLSSKAKKTVEKATK